MIQKNYKIKPFHLHFYLNKSFGITKKKEIRKKSYNFFKMIFYFLNKKTNFHFFWDFYLNNKVIYTKNNNI